MAVAPRKVKNKRDANGNLTGRAGTVYDVNIKYSTPDGKKATYSKKGFLTRKEAEGHEAEIKAKLQAPTFAATVKEQRRQTVKDYLEEWVESYARVNLRPSTYDGYKRTIANYIVPYIGNVPLNQLSGQTVDKMFQNIIDKGLKPSTAAGAKRVLSVALNHARKYHFIETNAARDTLTKFGKGDKTPDPYTPEQVRALLERVAGTEWEMPVVLGGLYGMRRSEVLGLRWHNVDLEKGTFDVVEQLPFHVPPKTTVIEEMAPPKSNGRRLPITDVARPFFERQLARLDTQRRDAEKAGTPYYDNNLVICKSNGAPQAANWISSGFFIDLIDGIFLQVLINVYDTMRKWFKIKVFHISSFILPYLRTRWFCKTGHHLGTKKLCRILFENLFLSILFPYFSMIFGRASIGRGYPLPKSDLLGSLPNPLYILANGC